MCASVVRVHYYTCSFWLSIQRIAQARIQCVFAIAVPPNLHFNYRRLRFVWLSLGNIHHDVGC